MMYCEVRERGCGPALARPLLLMRCACGDGTQQRGGDTFSFPGSPGWWQEELWHAVNGTWPSRVLAMGFR